MPPGLPVVHLDINPWELGKNYPAVVAIQGDPKPTLPEITEAVRRLTGTAGPPQAGRRREAQAAAHAQQRGDLEGRARSEAGRVPMSPLALVHALAVSVPDDAVIIDESISSALGVRHLFRCADPRSFYGLRGGGIGWGLPNAMGVKLALPRRPVVALIGDGSAMYTAQGLWTAARESLGVLFVIFNNASYRILKQRVRLLKGFSAEDDRYVAMDLERPAIDFIGLARSLGVPGERVEKAADVAGAVTRGLAESGPYLIDARIDPSVT
jgi:benzoylformate decarboxylase